MRIVVAAPVIKNAARSRPGLENLLRLAALQIRDDYLEEQRILVTGSARIRDAANYVARKQYAHDPWRYNLIEIKHAVCAEDGQLVARTKRLPIYFETQLSESTLSVQHQLNVDVLVGGPESDAAAAKAALGRINAHLLSPSSAGWRRKLFSQPFTPTVVTGACTALDVQLKELIASERASVDIKRFELAIEQTAPKPTARIQSEVLPTPLLGSDAPTRLFSEHLIVEPKRARLVQEKTLRRSESITLPPIHGIPNDDGLGRTARFDYVVVSRTCPVAEGQIENHNLTVRFQLADERFEPVVVNHFLRLVQASFGRDVLGTADVVQGIHPRLPTENRRFLFTANFSHERLRRAYNLLQRLSHDEAEGAEGFVWRIITDRFGIRQTNLTLAKLRESMGGPFDEAFTNVTALLNDAAYGDAIALMAALWRLGSPDIFSGEPDETRCTFTSDSGLYERILQEGYKALKRFEARKPARDERVKLRERAGDVGLRIEQINDEILLEVGIRDAIGQRLRRLFFDYARVLDVDVIENGRPVV